MLWAGVLLAEPPTDGQQTVDQMLKQAQDHGPGAFMFQEQTTSQCDAKRDLIITSAQGVQQKPEPLTVRPGTMRVFRANSSLDEFTQQGGWYWRCSNVEGRSQFKQPGALILVVYQLDGTIHWYSLAIDFRC
jgi:hypothetical protein